MRGGAREDFEICEIVTGDIGLRAVDSTRQLLRNGKGGGFNSLSSAHSSEPNRWNSAKGKDGMVTALFPAAIALAAS